MELRIVQLHNTDGSLGIEGADPEDTGAVEFWHGDKRVLELVWHEGSFASTRFVATHDRSSTTVDVYGVG